jgi:hypothetical protein
VCRFLHTFPTWPRSVFKMDAIKRAANSIKDKLTKSPLERDLAEAMNNENWGAPNTMLHSIADRSYNPDDAAVAMKVIWENIRANSKEWRKIYKTLVLLEILLKHGSTRCVQEIRDETFKIRLLQDFSYMDAGQERGNGIREKSRVISEMISDYKKLEEEREKAR